MKINLAWLLVPAMPFVVATFLLSLCAFVGVEVSGDGAAFIVFFSAFCGLFLSGVVVLAIHEGDIDWTITIGKERD